MGLDTAVRPSSGSVLRLTPREATEAATTPDHHAQDRARFDIEGGPLVKELQVYDAGKFYNQKVGIAGSFGHLAAVRNFYTYRGARLAVGTMAQARAFIDPNQVIKKA